MVEDYGFLTGSDKEEEESLTHVVVVFESLALRRQMMLYITQSDGMNNFK